MRADIGIVKTHAHTTLPAIPHRTADNLRVAPTPTIPPVIVCVVLTGIPPYVDIKIEAAPAVSAANPPTGLSLVIRDPIVCTMRQPPVKVPSPIAAWQVSTTHNGI